MTPRSRAVKLKRIAWTALRRAADALATADRSDAVGAVVHDQPRMALGYIAECEAEVRRAREACEEWARIKGAEG